MKVDVTKIEGYENMSAEEKIAALEAFEIDDPAGDENLKKLLSKRNSENAELTKQLREKMSAEEKRDADIAEKDARIAELENEKKLNTYINSYVSLGFSAEEAQKQANLLLEGKFDEVIANHKTHVEKISKQAVADAMTKEHLSKGEPPEKKEPKEFPSFF